MSQHLVEEVINITEVFKGKVINLRIDQVLLPDGRNATREVVEHPGAVAVVPVHADGSVILVRQYRHAVGKVLLEIPAGKLDLNEDPDMCAARELEEETGCRALNIKKLAAIFTTPGFSDE